MHLVLFQPDIPQNLGAALRLGACLDVHIDIIHPCGFALTDKAIRRSAMDYGACAKVSQHDCWAAYQQSLDQSWGGRVILLTTRAALPYYQFDFRPDDHLMVGRESAGVPDDIFAACPHRLLIPMAQGIRSMNVINAAALVLGEALRQTTGFPVMEAQT